MKVVSEHGQQVTLHCCKLPERALNTAFSLHPPAEREERRPSISAAPKTV